MNADWYVYVLECSDDTLYTGITTEPERRLREHNESSAGAAYTRARRPVEMRALWPCEDQSEAASAEAAFKQLTRDEKLERLEVGLAPDQREALAAEYLRVFEVGDASPDEIRPLTLAGTEGEPLRRARRYRELVDGHLDRLADLAANSPLAETVERIEPRFAVGPGYIDGHGLLVDGEPRVLFDMRLIDRHFDEESFRPAVHAAHELTHALHYGAVLAFYPGRDKSPAEEVWHRLVAEGLAERVSERLTGCGGRLSTWFGFVDEATFEAWCSNARSRGDELVSVFELESSIRFDGGLWNDLFRGTDDLETTRLGYWWGRRIVERAERDRELDELLTLSPGDWRPYVRAAIDEF